MLELKVEGMSCGHCVQAITRAVEGVDTAAKVDVDLPSQRVMIHTDAETSSVTAAIEEAGYEVVDLTA